MRKGLGFCAFFSVGFWFGFVIVAFFFFSYFFNAPLWILTPHQVI